LARSASLLVLAVLMVVLVGCGSHNAGVGRVDRTLTGVVTEDDFTVPAGQRYACSGDVMVICQTATILGELFSRPVTGSGQDGSSITIEAEADIVATGQVTAGAGTDGTSEDAGGDGGDVTLTSANGGITAGSDGTAQTGPTPGIAPGNAGNGADGKLGAAGGEGGSVFLNCPNGTLTIHPSAGLFHIGDGGRGGDGTMTDADLGAVTVPEQLTNAGGDAGDVYVDAATVVGATTIQTPDLPTVHLVGADVVTGGAGGDGGGFTYSRDGTSDSDRELPTGGSATWTNGELEGSNGGNGPIIGGHGEVVKVDFSGDYSGSSVQARKVIGGDGGRAGLWGKGITHVFRPDVTVRGGDGGNAELSGAPGADSVSCGAGGAAGSVAANGGSGGDVSLIGVQGRAVPGNGGDAKATGGVGGNGGSCCSPPGQGGEGGDGAHTDATGGDGGRTFLRNDDQAKDGPGGDAWAHGGEGGEGGRGAPGGAGGSGGHGLCLTGDGNPEGKCLRQEPGGSGAKGGTCPTTPPPTPGPDDIIGRITPLGLSLSYRLKLDGGVLGTESAGAAVITTTDANGYYVFHNVQPGDHNLFPADVAVPPEYWMPAWRQVTKVAGVALTDQDFELKTGAKHTVTVRINDQNGDPMPNVQVTLYGFTPGLGDHNGTTGADGRAVIPDVWSGTYSAVAGSQPPAGFKWDPAEVRVMVADSDITSAPIRLVPE